MLATILFYALLIVAWSSVALWLIAICWTQRELKIFKLLRQINLSPLNEAPRVSILLPARNEEKRILSDCVRSLLAQTYPNFEIIAVNDCSTDRTGEILREFAKENSRLRVVEGAQLPANWLGKPFVLQQACSKADGEWILTVDADIIFSPDAVETALAYVAEQKLDALCLIPFVICETFWETLFMPTFNWFRMLAMPPSSVNNPKRSETMGVGNFFLIRRQALEKVGGFATVKRDVAEDLRLAQALKQSGAKIKTEYAPDLLKTRMYAGFAEIWRGFTKNFFASSNFSIVQTISGAGSILLCGVLPSVFFFVLLLISLVARSPLQWQLFLPLLLIYILQIALFGLLNREYKLPLGFAIFAPLGLALFAAILINSMIKVLSGSGVTWKEREIYKSGEQPSTQI